MTATGGWIYYVAVDPDQRHKGLGRAAVKAGEEWLKDRNVAKLQLMIRETNIEVAAFYEGAGFKKIPRTVMEKWLKPSS